MCESNKSSDFSLRRLRSKMVLVACETGMCGVFCRLLRLFSSHKSLPLINVPGSNGTSASDLLYHLEHPLRIKLGCIPMNYFQKQQQQQRRTDKVTCLSVGWLYWGLTPV